MGSGSASKRCSLTLVLAAACAGALCDTVQGRSQGDGIHSEQHWPHRASTSLMEDVNHSRDDIGKTGNGELVEGERRQSARNHRLHRRQGHHNNHNDGDSSVDGIGSDSSAVSVRGADVGNGRRKARHRRGGGERSWLGRGGKSASGEVDVLPSAEQVLDMINNAERQREERVMKQMRAKESSITTQQRRHGELELRREREREVKAQRHTQQLEAQAVRRMQQAAAARVDEAQQSARRKEVERLHEQKSLQKSVNDAWHTAAGEAAEAEAVASAVATKESKDTLAAYTTVVQTAKANEDRMRSMDMHALEMAESQQAKRIKNATAAAEAIAAQAQSKAVRVGHLMEQHEHERSATEEQRASKLVTEMSERVVAAELAARDRDADAVKAARMRARRRETALRQGEDESRRVLGEREEKQIESERKREDRIHVQRWVDSARLRKREEVLRRVEDAREAHQQREQLYALYKDVANDGGWTDGEHGRRGQVNDDEGTWEDEGTEESGTRWDGDEDDEMPNDKR